MKKIVLTIMSAVALGSASACTNFLITAGASANCGNIVTYAADSHQLYGSLYHFAAADYPENSYMDVYDWDSGKFMGKITQTSHTYNVVGNCNEHQLTIAETTYGGLEQLYVQKDAVIDYGSLIYITLQRCTTARQAIKFMSELTSEYGYASEGESFSIADKNEVWIMDLIGKGNFGKGMVWVARRVPQGYICAHANQARITTFDYQKKNQWNNPDAQTFNSADVVEFAIKNNLYKGTVKDFSFSDVYAPLNFEGARFSELRVWAFFNFAAPETFGKNADYFDYAKGNVKRAVAYNGGCQTKENFASNRLPLWIKPDRKLTVRDAMNAMRDHLENTELDMSKDHGAGYFHCPYRMRPLSYKVDGKVYINERATATQQTGFVFVSQMRSWLPDEVGGIFWFGTDDAASTVFAPFYCSINRVPIEYSSDNGSMIKWSDNSCFWINNLISNWAYTRYDLIHPEIVREQQLTEEQFINLTSETDKKAMQLTDRAEFLTEFSCNNASQLVKMRIEFFTYLFMKYMDGNVKHNGQGNTLKDNGNGKDIPELDQPGYGTKWQEDVARSTGDKLLEK